MCSQRSRAGLHAIDLVSYAHVEAGGVDDEGVEVKLRGVVVVVGTSTDLGCRLLQSHTGPGHSSSLHKSERE